MNKTSKQLQIESYKDKANIIIQPLIYQLFKAMPEDIVQWMIQWLNTTGLELQQPDHSPLRHDDYHVSSDEEVNEEEEEEVGQLLIPLANQKPKGSRSSVSAEVYGMFNKKEDFIPRVIPKSEDQKQRILEKLNKSFMFEALEHKEQQIVLNAMEEKHYSAGDWIITQGDDGAELYIVDQGELDCYKKFTKDGEPQLLKTYQPGEAFGELALLYNAPRAASIQSKGDSILFALDRATFNNIVKDAAVKKRERYESVLHRVEILQQMEAYERMHVCDGIKAESVAAGEYVIREGEEGDKFYMIEEGELAAYQDNNGEQIEVMSYKSGAYFGELSLLGNVPRQASIKTITDTKLIYLDREAFKRLLGPIESILKRNAAIYQKFVKK